MKSSNKNIIQNDIHSTSNCYKIHWTFESPNPLKMELMILYAVIKGIPAKHMVKYAVVPSTACCGVDMIRTIG